MIHNLLVLGRYVFSVAVPGLSQSDMLACQLPGTGMTTDSLIWLIHFSQNVFKEELIKCRLNNLLNAQSKPQMCLCVNETSCLHKGVLDDILTPWNLVMNKGLTAFKIQSPCKKKASLCLVLNGEVLSFPWRHLSLATTLRASFKQRNLAIMWH